MGRLLWNFDCILVNLSISEGGVSKPDGNVEIMSAYFGRRRADLA